MYIPFSFFDMEIEGNTGWFIHALYPALFSYDFKTDKCELETILPMTGAEGFAAYGSIKKYKNKLVIAPRCTQWLLFYDLEYRSIDKVKLDLECMAGKEIYNLFFSMYIVDNYAYLFPGRYPAIVKVNLENKEVTYIDNWYTKYTEKTQNSDLYFFPPTNNKGWVYMPDLKTGSYINFSMQDETYEIRRVMNDIDVGIKAILHKDENYFLVLTNNQIMWNEKILSVNKFSDCAVQFIICYKKMLFVIPLKGGYIRSYDLELHTWKNVFRLKNTFDDGISAKLQKADYNFFSCVQNGNKLYLASVYDGTMLVLNMDTGSAKNIIMMLSEKDKRKILEFRYKDIVYENEHFALGEFLMDLQD